MDMLKKFFPFSFGAADVKALVIKIVVYVVASFVVGFVAGLLSQVPVLGLVLGIVNWLFGLYSTAGVVFAILAYVKVLK